MRKGQAAMEFLMTYGWAILAAIIAIGVLAYFGVFTPGKYVSGTAVVTPPFYVNAHNVKAGGAGAAVINLELKNNGGEEYEVQSIVVAVSTPEADTCTTTGTATVSPSGTHAFELTCANALDTGDALKGDITITYHKADSTTDLTSTGTIAEKVTA